MQTRHVLKAVVLPQAVHLPVFNILIHDVELKFVQRFIVECKTCPIMNILPLLINSTSPKIGTKAEVIL